jgi:hypothetical protein
VLTGIAKKTRRSVNKPTGLTWKKHVRDPTCYFPDADGDVSVVADVGSNNATQITELVCEMNAM